MSTDDPLSLHRQELRRGTVVLACLSVLRTPAYGYALLETLEDPSDLADELRAIRAALRST